MTEKEILAKYIDAMGEDAYYLGASPETQMTTDHRRVHIMTGLYFLTENNLSAIMELLDVVKLYISNGRFVILVSI